jgi:hypothetical protein
VQLLQQQALGQLAREVPCNRLLTGPAFSSADDPQQLQQAMASGDCTAVVQLLHLVRIRRSDLRPLLQAHGAGVLLVAGWVGA